jgi:hypothetical protein
VDVTVKGDKQAAAAVAMLGVRARDIHSLDRQVGDVVHQSTRHRFDTDADGSWNQLADSTVTRKEIQGLDPRINRATGALYASLTHGRAEPGPRDELRYGSSVPYAGFVDARRKLIELRPQEQNEVTQIIASYITSKSDRSWFFQ